MNKTGRVFRFLLIVAILGAGVYLLYPGFTRLIELRRELYRKARTIERWERANAELKREIRALQSDAHAVEKVAREKLGLVKPDEIIYKFKDEESAPNEAGSKQ